MLSIDGLLEAIENDIAFDSATLRRGLAYARNGHVRQIKVSATDGGLIVVGTVLGSRLYPVKVDAYDLGRDGIEMHSDCACPLAYDCKHVVALLMAAQFDANGGPTGPDWRRLLDQVLDDAAQRNVPEVSAPYQQVAVQIVLPPPRPPSRYASTPVLRPRLAVRAVRSGATKRWVKAGMGWGELEFRSFGPNPSAPHLDPTDVELLTSLKLALLGRRAYLNSTNDPLDLSDAAPRLWATLAKLVERGIPLVSSDPAIEIELAEHPAALQLDLSGTDDAVAVRPGILVDDSWYAGTDVGFIGEPAHGVVLWQGAPGQAGTVITLAKLSRSPSRSERSWLTSTGELLVRDAAIDELFAEYLPRIAESVTVGSRDGSVQLPEAAEISLRCDLTWDDDGGVALDWRWTYRRGDEVQQFPVDGSGGPRGWRSRSAETALINRLDLSDELTNLLSLDAFGRGTLMPRRRFRDVEAMTFARDHLPELVAHPDIEVITNGAPPDFREVTGVPEVRFVSRGDAERKNRTDWLELEITISIPDERHGVLTIDLARVLAALASGQTVIMLRPGVYIDVDRPELDQLARLVQDARALTDQPPGGLRLSRQAHGLLADVHEIGPTEGQLEAWAATSARLRDLAESGAPLPAVPLPAGLQATLRPYQHDGFQWLDFLRRFALGGILADDMGLGKTLQTLAMIAAARQETPTGPGFLVVAPSSVVSTWRSEAARFTPGLRVATITESSSRRGWPVAAAIEAQNADIVVTTYTLLRLEVDQYAAITWAGVILDEAQMVKNSASKTHAAIRSLESASRFAITGTPIENNLMELWSILSLTAPGLFPHAEAFRNEIAQPIEQQADAEALAGLRRRIKPVMLRRTKDLVAADLPEKQEQVIMVELAPRHRKIYDTHLQRERQRILKLLDDLDENRITILASLTRLRQLALDPALVDPEHEAVGSAKIDQLIDRLVEVIAEGHRALVFSQFTGFLARVRHRLETAGIAYAYLDGGTRHRATVIDDWRDGGQPVFLISLKAGGVGLNLTEADYCFLLDPWWNPAVESQAIDRTHRIGQTRSVMVYRMVSADTIEEKVVELAQRKAELYRSVLDADGQLSAKLTADDIAALLGR